MIWFTLNMTYKRLGTGYQLARTEWDWNARLLIVRSIFFPLYNNASFLFDLKFSLWISISLLCNRVFSLDCFSSSFLFDFGLSFPIEPAKFTPCILFQHFYHHRGNRSSTVDWIHLYMYFLNSQENSDPSFVR